MTIDKLNRNNKLRKNWITLTRFFWFRLYKKEEPLLQHGFY